MPITALPIKTILQGNPVDPEKQPDAIELTQYLEETEAVLETVIPSIERFDAATGNSGAANKTAIEAAIAATIAAGNRTLFVPSGTFSVSATAQIADCIFVGDGEFIGPVFDKVHRQFEGSRTIESGINPKLHMRNFASAANPVVVIVGDSIATNKPTTSVNEVDSMWGIIQRRIREDNPDKNITFYNRAIGGATWTSINKPTGDATGLTLPDWFTDPSTKAWMVHVEDLAPDLVIFASGMNDRENFVTVQFKAVMETVDNWSKATDRMFITNMVPSRMTATGSLSDEVSQIGRHFVAGYIRQWAEFEGYGFIDLHQQYCITREGIDPRASHFIRQYSATAITLPHAEAVKCADFVYFLTFTSSATFFSGRRLRVGLSAENANGVSWLDIYESGGNIAVELSDNDNAPGKYTTVVSDVALPASGSHVLGIAVKDNMIKVSLDDTTVDGNIYEGMTRRHGGPFFPRLKWTDASATGFTATFWQGKPIQYMPQLTDAEMWGNGSDNTGNDQNHPTSYGANLVYSQAFANQDFRSDQAEVFINIPSLADDAAMTIPVPFGSGVFELLCSNTGTGALVQFNALATPTIGYSIAGANTAVVTPGTNLTGTTGADTKMNISVKNGEIMIENRRGTLIGSLRYRFYGAP
tara:strand:- start:29543 stop:31468 length:1926 start_codon:yes stop_codon:yes gene_type:complete